MGSRVRKTIKLKWKTNKQSIGLALLGYCKKWKEYTEDWGNYLVRAKHK